MGSRFTMLKNININKVNKVILYVICSSSLRSLRTKNIHVNSHHYKELLLKIESKMKLCHRNGKEHKDNFSYLKEAFTFHQHVINSSWTTQITSCLAGLSFQHLKLTITVNLSPDCFHSECPSSGNGQVFSAEHLDVLFSWAICVSYLRTVCPTSKNQRYP